MVLFWSINGDKPGKTGEVGPPVNGRLLLHFPLFALRAQRGVLLCEAPATADRSEKQMPKQQPSDQKAVTRKGSSPLKVYCLPSERDQITANAQAVGLTVSTYLLRVGAGYEIKSTLDSQLVAELAKVNADLGRLGGLLKLWLTDDKKLAVVGNAWTQGTVRALLKRLEDTQAAMLETVRRI